MSVPEAATGTTKPLPLRMWTKGSSSGRRRPSGSTSSGAVASSSSAQTATQPITDPERRTAGYDMLLEMDKGINDVEQSRYLSFPSDLIKWGYVVEEDRRVRQDWKGPKYTVEGVYRLVGILGALNCPNTGQFRYMAAYHRDPQNANKRLVQQRTYKSPTTKKDMPRTGARYIIGFNATDGVLLIPEVWGHDYMRHKDKAPPLGRNEYPDLRHASDIIYGLMMSAIRMYSVPWNGTKTIEHIIIWGITNDELNGVIGNIITDVQRCLRSDGRYKNRVEKVPSPLLWPGIEVDVEGQYGSWLLGTRLGKTVARFLSQHKYLLRHKLTTRAIIFQQVLSANAMPYSVYFQVLDKAYYGSRKPKVSWTLLNQGYE